MTETEENQNREQLVADLQEKLNEEALWHCIVAFQEYEFKTYSGLSFSYKLKEGKHGQYARELFIDRRENSKSLAFSSIWLAFRKVMELKLTSSEKKPVIHRPKALGDIRGVTYIYAMFYRFGLVDVPDNVRDKMQNNSV